MTGSRPAALPLGYTHHEQDLELRPGVEPGSVAYEATASPAMLPELESQVGLEPTKRDQPQQIKSLLPLPLGSLVLGAGCRNRTETSVLPTHVLSRLS